MSEKPTFDLVRDEGAGRAFEPRERSRSLAPGFRLPAGPGGASEPDGCSRAPFDLLVERDMSGKENGRRKAGFEELSRVDRAKGVQGCPEGDEMGCSCLAS